MRYNYVWSRDNWDSWNSTLRHSGDYTSETSVTYTISSLGGIFDFYVDVVDERGEKETVGVEGVECVPPDPYDDSYQWLSSSTDYSILVDTINHYVTVYEGSRYNWRVVERWQCGDGKSSTPTVKGSFTVGSRGYYFDSGNARCFYWTQFYGNYLFHSTLYYQTYSPTSPMDDRVGLGISHGCVRLKLENAKWIYDNIPWGTKVYVF